MLRLQLQPAYRGLMITTGAGAELLNVGVMLGVPYTVSVDDVTVIGFLDEQDTDAERRLYGLAKEVRNARARLGAWDAAEVSSEWGQVLGSVLAHTDSLVAVFDVEMRYVFVNEALAALHNMSTRDHNGRSLREVLGEVADAVEVVLREVFGTGVAVGPYTFTHTLPGQSVRCYQAWYSPVLIAGEVRHVSVSLCEQPQIDAPRDNTLERCIIGLQDLIGEGEGAALLAALVAELDQVGLIGDSCLAHEVAVQRVALARQLGDVTTVVRWRLTAGNIRVRVPRCLLGDVVVSAIMTVAGFGGVVDVRTEILDDELVFLVRGVKPVQSGVMLARTDELVALGGEVRVDGDVTICVPVVVPVQGA